MRVVVVRIAVDVDVVGIGVLAVSKWARAVEGWRILVRAAAGHCCCSWIPFGECCDCDWQRHW